MDTQTQNIRTSNRINSLSKDEILDTLLNDDSLLFNIIIEVMNGKPMNVKKIRNTILRRFDIQRAVTSTDIQRLSSKISLLLRQRSFILDHKNSRKHKRPLYIPPDKYFNGDDGYD